MTRVTLEVGYSDADLDELRQKVLARLEPSGVSNDVESWQQRKSMKTRIAILEAAISCLAEYGYAQTTTKMVAHMASVSRGAMLHHYATKRDLIEHVTGYTFFKRMERTFDAFRQLSDRERTQDMSGIDIYWENTFFVEYQAYLELSIASRTDEELQSIFEPKAREFHEIQFAELSKIFPEWQDKLADLTLANDFVIATFDGILLNQSKWNDKTRVNRLRSLIKQVVYMMREGEINISDL